ncbi:hypothetical protein [Robiginitomaculum antarcticum]|uniref:hypothetical protein n=1 Tax=Robiginitomaculum antarcticum TaxID=437507 RepID=UPI00035EE27B|nr:hypothetical protein [Robiginitomaculum antarcticum]
MKILMASAGALLFSFTPPVFAQSACDQFKDDLSNTQKRDRSGSLGEELDKSRGGGPLSFSTCEEDSLNYADEVRKLDPKGMKPKPAADPQWGILRPELTNPIDIEIVPSSGPQVEIVKPDEKTRRQP